LLVIDRRQVLGGALGLMAPGAAAFAASVLPVPGGGKLGFDVLRGSRKLGEHNLVFRNQGGELVVDVTVDLAFRIGPITLFRYTHQNTERWSGGQVSGLSSRTLDNGKRLRVIANRQAGALVVEPAGRPRYTAPESALPATHWNRRQLDGPWINPQDGELMRPTITPRGPGTIRTADGAPLKARCFAVSGPAQFDLWYDGEGAWAGLNFVKGGAEIRYLRRGA